MKGCIVFWNEEDQQNLFSWWSKLKENRSWKAELKRTEKPEDAFLAKGFRSLYYEMAGSYWIKEENVLALASVAGILAHIDENDSRHLFAESCAIPMEGKQKSPVSELRFSQLQKSMTLDELFIRMRRSIQLLGKKANVISVADSIFHWHKEMVNGKPETEKINRIRIRWGLNYFQNLPRE